MPSSTWRNAVVAALASLAVFAGLGTTAAVAAPATKASAVKAAAVKTAPVKATAGRASTKRVVKPVAKRVVKPATVRRIGPVAPARTAGARTAAKAPAAAKAPTAAVTPTAAPVPAASGPVFGAQFHGMWSSYTDAQRDRVLATMAAHGVENVRIDLSWAMLQPTGPGSYDPWGVGFADSVIDRAVRHGLRPHITFWLTPAWANGGAGERVLPTDVADYARAAGWAAKRWAGKVAAYEVWNEPNSDDFLKGSDPAAYARLLKAAYPAVKAADPAAKVVLGGAQYVDVDWVEAVLAAGAAKSFDVVGVNPYMGISDASPLTADDGSRWTMRHVKVLREAVVAAGRADAPIWFTEFGWSVRSTPADAPNWARGVTAETQAQYLVETLRMLEAEMPYVTQVFWYQDLVDIEPGFNGGYGLVHQDGTPTKALQALKDHKDHKAHRTA